MIVRILSSPNHLCIETISRFKYDLARTYERIKDKEYCKDAIGFFLDGFNRAIASPDSVEALMYRDVLVTVIYERREISK